ncbi:hypothetical protein [Burkholderia stagnalis]|nr:hypothetical protein [Burkholderia stagnalis]
MTLLKTFEAALVPLLEAEGFKKRSGEIFTLQLAEGFIGWLGLNRAKRPEGFELNPVVGVRCQALEDLLSTLLKERPHKYVPPTVAISLGYLMPERQYRSWILREETTTVVAADIVTTIVRYGFPLMASACTLREMGGLLESPRFTSADHAAYRRPLIKWLLGDRKGALQTCASACQKLEARSDPAAEHFRQFARGLESLANQIDA